MMLLTARRILAIADRHGGSVLLLLCAAVFAGLAEAAAILVVVRVAVDLAADTVSSDFVPFVSAPTSVGMALLIAAALALATLASHLVIAVETSTFSADVLRNARRRSLRAFTQASWTTQSGQRLGALQETVATLSLLSSTLAQSLATGTANLVMLVMFIVVAATVNVLATAAVAVAGLLLFALVRPLTVRTRESSQAFTRADTGFAEDTANFASTAMEFRVFGVGGVALSQLEERLDDVADKQRSVRFRAAFGTTLYRDVAVLLLVGSVGMLSLLDQSAMGSASAVVVLIVRALASAHAVNAMVQVTNERGPTVELLEERIASLRLGTEPTGVRHLSEVHRFELSDVGYRYPDGAPVLNGVSLSFRRGEKLGIAGPSGSGKSTLLQVLLRLRRPTAGSILVNGVDYVEFDEESWSDQVAYVPQEPTLFEGTVAENVAFFREFSDGEIEDAAAHANVLDEIRALPDGFDTCLGPGGSGLSGGQKQRVAIARALISHPSLLILDEPSSALDPASEGLLGEAIERLGDDTTVLVVAHRESTLAACERIVTVEAGRVTFERRTDEP